MFSVVTALSELVPSTTVFSCNRVAGGTPWRRLPWPLHSCPVHSPTQPACSVCLCDWETVVGSVVMCGGF